jgi:hypothetical protein
MGAVMVLANRAAGVNLLSDKDEANRLGLNDIYKQGPDELIANQAILRRYFDGTTVTFEAIATTANALQIREHSNTSLSMQNAMMLKSLDFCIGGIASLNHSMDVALQHHDPDSVRDLIAELDTTASVCKDSGVQAVALRDAIGLQMSSSALVKTYQEVLSRWAIACQSGERALSGLKEGLITSSPTLLTYAATEISDSAQKFRQLGNLVHDIRIDGM